ncbi:hypothetical protein C8R45DRAFT_1027702 [Mycena sanguinolenta]|nr:hypothetical protein C8R45DRAFT_1027702 [Mycena sanguinolenta]
MNHTRYDGSTRMPRSRPTRTPMTSIDIKEPVRSMAQSFPKPELNAKGRALCRILHFRRVSINDISRMIDVTPASVCDAILNEPALDEIVRDCCTIGQELRESLDEMVRETRAVGGVLARILENDNGEHGVSEPPSEPSAFFGRLARYFACLAHCLRAEIMACKGIPRPG